MESLLILYVASGLLLCGLSIPLILKKIPPNVFYGFRVPRTVNNPRIWYAVNQYAGKRLLVCGLLIALAAVGLYFIPGISVDIYATAVAVVLMVTLTASLIQSFKYLRALPDE